MDNPENLTPLPSPQPLPDTQTELSDLQERCDALSTLVFSLLVLLLVVSGTIWIFLRWQVRNAGRDLDNARPQVASMIAQYEKGPRQAQDKFISQLLVFGRTNSDFAPVLAKYPMIKAGGPTNAPLVGPSPAVPPAKK
jgi:hypothetical protein